MGRANQATKAMRAVAQDRLAAQLMGIPVDRVIGQTFLIGGGLAGVASVVSSVYNNTIYFQMGYRAGIDAFTAAVLGGIGSLPGAVLGGLVIGLARALCDQYIETRWTNVLQQRCHRVQPDRRVYRSIRSSTGSGRLACWWYAHCEHDRVASSPHRTHTGDDVLL